MAVHLIFHIENDALGDPGIDVTFNNRDHLRCSKRNESSDQKLDQKTEVIAEERFIDDLSRDDRRQKSDNGRKEDREDHEGELKLIGLHVGGDTLQELLIDLRFILLLFFRQETARA